KQFFHIVESSADPLFVSAPRWLRTAVILVYIPLTVPLFPSLLCETVLTDCLTPSNVSFRFVLREVDAPCFLGAYPFHVNSKLLGCVGINQNRQHVALSRSGQIQQSRKFPCHATDALTCFG